MMMQRQKYDPDEELDAMGDAVSRGHSRADDDNTMVSDAVESQLTDASEHATNASDEETNDE